MTVTILREYNSKNCKHNNQKDVLEEFYKKFLDSQQDMPEKYYKVLNDNFWELLNEM